VASVSFVALFLEMFCSMDFFDNPKACPLIEGQPFRYSVGFYRGKSRHVVAWFADQSAAIDYCTRMREQYPFARIDYLSSFF